MRKGFYPYKYIDEWEKINETSLPEKQDFYSRLNMEDITDADYGHAKRVYKDFKRKNFGESHDLYFQSDAFSPLDGLILGVMSEEKANYDFLDSLALHNTELVVIN